MQAETTDARSAWEKWPRPPVGTDFPSDWVTLIHAFDEDRLRSTLITIACSPQVPAQRFILDAYRGDHLAERARLVARNRHEFRFNHVSQRVEDNLDQRLRGVEARDAALQVFGEINEAIESVRSSVTVDSSYGTKCNALHALMQIGRNILNSCHDLGDEVRKQFQNDSCLEAAMIDVIEVMFEAEKMHLRGYEKQDSPTVWDLSELDEDAADLHIFEKLSDVIELLCGGAQRKQGSDGDCQ